MKRLLLAFALALGLAVPVGAAIELVTHDDPAVAATCYYNPVTGGISGRTGWTSNSAAYGSPDCYNHRPKVRCRVPSTGSVYYLYGSWKNAPGFSGRTCQSGHTATDVWIQKTTSAWG